jgi:hemoglobin
MVPITSNHHHYNKRPFFTKHMSLSQTSIPCSNAQRPTLYDRVGGIYVIAQLVERFSAKLIHDPVVGVTTSNQRLAAWYRVHGSTKMPGLQFMRTLWLADKMGGPFKFIPTNRGQCPFALSATHASLQMSPAEWKHAAIVLGETAQQMGLGNPEIVDLIEVMKTPATFMSLVTLAT